MPIFATDRIFMRTSCDRPALSSNPLRISARIFYCAFVSVFSFLHYFPAIRPFPDKGNSKIRISLSPPCRRIFTVFCYYAPNGSLLRISQNGNNRGFPLSERIVCFQKARASSVLSFRRYASDILFVSIFIRPCDRSHRAVLLDSDFASEKCANACGAR